MEFWLASRLANQKRINLVGLLTDFTHNAGVSRTTQALVGINTVNTRAAISARATGTFYEIWGKKTNDTAMFKDLPLIIISLNQVLVS